MKRFVILGVVVLLVVGGWTAAWLWAANEIRKGAAMLAEADGLSSPKVLCATLDIGGYPFRFDVTCEGATLISGDLVTNLAGIEAQVLVYQPTHVLASAKGPLTFDDYFTGSSSRIDFAGAQASVSLADWRVGRVSLVADDVVWNDTVLDDLLLAKADHLDLQILDIPAQHQPDAGLAALAGYLRADRVMAPGLAIEDGDVSLQADLTGLPDDIRNFADSQAMLRWLQSGGALQIYEAKGTDGDDFLDGTGLLTLNAAARLQGEVTIASRGVVEDLEPLFQPGIGPLIFGSAGPDGTYSQTLKIDNGIVYSGLIVVGEFPPLL